MKKEKQVKSYQRRTKSGKVVTVKAHTAKYDAAEKAKEAAKKKGAGKELEDKFGKKKMPDPNLSMNEYLDELKKGNSKKESEVKEAAKKESKKNPEGKKDTTNKSNISGQAFTAAEFKEWYHGTGSAADKKVAKALRAQLGRSGYRKFEDEAINNYSSRGHLSMFKRVNGKSVGSTPTKTMNIGDVRKKFPAAIKRHLASYEKELSKLQDRKDKGLKYVGVPNNAKAPRGGKLLKVSDQIKYVSGQIANINKGKEAFQKGKLDTAWKYLRGFTGVTESSIYGRKTTSERNKKRAADELASFKGQTGSGRYGNYINGKKVSDKTYETHLRKSGYYDKPRPTKRTK